MHLRCSRSSLVVSCSVFSCSLDRSLLRTTKLLNVWIKGDKIKRKTKLKLYRSLVKSILVYNCGTWALTKSEEEKLNAFHRKQLRKVLNIKYPVKITNSSLYNKCEEHPLSIYILENRWRLFGHILRRNIEIPANKSMNSYFATHGKKFRGRPLTTLPVVLLSSLPFSNYPSCDVHLFYLSFLLSSLPFSNYLSCDVHLFYLSFLLFSLPFSAHLSCDFPLYFYPVFLFLETRTYQSLWL